MRPERKPVRPAPDLEAEEELELGKYWSALVVRWWLPVVGLVAGIVVGYLLSLGGHQVYQAKANVYLGQPLNPTGTGPIQSLSTNPSTVKQVVLSPYWQHVAERRAGLASGSLRGHVSTQAVAGVAAALGRVGQNPLVNIVVTGKRPAQIARAADALAKIVVNQVSGRYVDTKIINLKKNIASDKAELDNINQRLTSLQQQIRGGGLSATDKLILGNLIGLAVQEQRQVIADQTQNQSLLALAQNVERSQVISPARASRR